jgi:sugar/nucleoside kinase (ribokinase family)
MNALMPPQFVLLGQLGRDYILPLSARPRMDIPGGNALYAAAGLSLWDSSIGIVARVGEDYPRVWLDDYADKGLNMRGVRILPQALDVRSFFAYTEGGAKSTDNPVGHFAQRGLSFPRSLLDYQDPNTREDSITRLTPYSLRQSDLPADYKHATTAHLGPVDYMTHSLMPAVLRQAGFSTLTLDPGPGYMKSSYWKYLPAILAGLTAFIVAEEELRALFQGRSADLWEMMSALGAYGCDMIVVKRGDQGQYLLVVPSGERWEIPAYPARFLDPTGAGDAFCGGFLAGYQATYDPLQAVLYGNVSASIVIEGTGALYALDVLPGLPAARLEVLQGAYRKLP